MHGRRAVAAALVILAWIAGAAVALAVQPSRSDVISQVSIAVPNLAIILVGLAVLRSRPGHPVGRLLVLGPWIATLGGGATEWGVHVLEQHPTDLAGRWAASLGATGRGAGWIALVLFLPLVFPDGPTGGPPRLTRWAMRNAQVALGLAVVDSLLSPAPQDLRVQDLDNPIGLPHSFTGVVDAGAGLMLVAGLLGLVLGAVVLIARFRAGSALRRQQILWLALAFVPPLALLAASFGDAGKSWMFGAAIIPIPVAVVLAIRQRRLYDVSLAVNRSLTYGSLWLMIAALYAVVVGGVGALLRREGAAWLPWVAAGVVAVSFAPLRDALQQAANRITYGQWARPEEVLARTNRRLADAGDLGELLGSLAADLGSGLGLASVEITGANGASLARYGPPDPNPDSLALTAYGEEVGRLHWTRRELRDSDRELLADLATQLGTVVHAHGAQERLVLAREEERRRLRRDLHDGLGPALAGLTLQVDTVRNTTGERSDEALLQLRSGIRDTVLDVRRIVEGLRPATLDSLGLTESVRQLALRTGLPVEVEGTDVTLPAAVEVAAYRIVQEALTNVAKHSGATRASIGLAAQADALVVRVADNGCGEVHGREGGVGLSSMRERAEEIGGSLEITSGAGTVVSAVLPLPVGGRA
jgi:signal transduction histidine kinase